MRLLRGRDTCYFVTSFNSLRIGKTHAKVTRSGFRQSLAKLKNGRLPHRDSRLGSFGCSTNMDSFGTDLTNRTFGFRKKGDAVLNAIKQNIMNFETTQRRLRRIAWQPILNLRYTFVLVPSDSGAEKQSRAPKSANDSNFMVVFNARTR